MVKVGLHQGSALSPFLFAIVMDCLTGDVRREAPWDMIFADDVELSEEECYHASNRLEAWRMVLERRGMRVSRSKTVYMCVGSGEKEKGSVTMDGKIIQKK